MGARPTHEAYSSMVKSRAKELTIVQLVRVNTEKCSPSKWHMGLSSNPATNDTLNLPSAGCCGAISTTRFGSL